MRNGYWRPCIMLNHDRCVTSQREWVDWVGRTRSHRAVLEPGPADRLAVTLDREPFARMGSVLPPAWHWLYFPELVTSSELGDDGHPRPGVSMPPGMPSRRMWAAGQIEFLAPLRIGQTATRVSTIKSVEPKDGRTGHLVFVTVDHTLFVEDDLMLREEQIIVYREPSAHSAGQGASPPTGPDFTDAWQLDNVTLFRYSALTFNSHRIHYDADYAREVEGYPGLVVHGPLLVTLMLDAALRRGVNVESIRYRAVSPVCLPDGFTVNGRREVNEHMLWAASDSGRLAMTATATTREDPDQ